MTRRRRGRGLAVAACLAVLATACSRSSPSMLRPAGSEAHKIAGVWWLMFGVAAAVYVVVAGFIIQSVLRGRRGEASNSSREGASENAFIWIGGVIGPTVILLGLAAVTVSSTTHLRQTEPGAVHVEVSGVRWWWRVRYPGTPVETANEIHLPVGKPAEITLTTEDVIHSFWVPELAGKLDTIPGQRNLLSFTVKRPGVYRGMCAEFCGVEHARMSLLVIAEPLADYNRWLARQSLTALAPTSELQAHGQVVFERLACAGCHTIRGTSADGQRGPDLTWFGSRRTLGAVTMTNDAGHLAGWIVNSQRTKPGNLMPPIEVSAADRDAIVAYLESLR